MFQGEEGKSRRKTEMCRAYQRGSCYWGSECNYAHDEDEMRAARDASEASIDSTDINSSLKIRSTRQFAS